MCGVCTNEQIKLFKSTFFPKHNIGVVVSFVPVVSVLSWETIEPQESCRGVRPRSSIVAPGCLTVTPMALTNSLAVICLFLPFVALIVETFADSHRALFV